MLLVSYRFDIAEVIKLEHALLFLAQNRAKNLLRVNVATEKFEFNRKDVEMVVEARLDEIFELVDKEFASN